MRQGARGFVLPSAIFLLVVLAALGAFALTLSSGQHAGAALDLQGEQAHQAAQAGVEFGLYQAANGTCAAETSFGFPGGQLAGFAVKVECTKASAKELTSTVDLFRIIATACNQPSCPGTAGGNYVERQLVAVTSR